MRKLDIQALKKKAKEYAQKHDEDLILDQIFKVEQTILNGFNWIIMEDYKFKDKTNFDKLVEHLKNCGLKVVRDGEGLTSSRSVEFKVE
jgi:hypothetical protein